MSTIDDDLVSNTSPNETFESVVAARVSRRSLLRGGAGAAVALSGADVLARAVPVHADGREHHGYGQGYGSPAGEPLLGFTGIPVSSADAVVVPDGYHAAVLIAWGDPVSDGPAYRPDASNTAADQAQQWGMHNDGIVYLVINGSSTHGLIVQNHEYTDDVLLFTDGVANWNAEKTAKSQNAHGVGIIEVRRRRGVWEVVRPSRYARRITAQTPMAFGGPAAGDDLLKTDFDPEGATVLGTVNTCAMGYTPWGTYLACEENFNGYFRVAVAPATGTPLQRYGVRTSPVSPWWQTHERFNTDLHPNEPNRFGWVTRSTVSSPRVVSSVTAPPMSLATMTSGRRPSGRRRR